MKTKLARKLAILFTLTVTSVGMLLPVSAATFDEQEVDQSLFVAIARPYGQNQYDLLVIEQIAGKKDCWAEDGSNPVLIDPLLLKFDFTGICRRSTDSNGYSIRVNGEDQGLNYILTVEPSNGELLLVGKNRNNPTQGEVLVGRTQGMASGFLKIILEPGWRITKRAYKGKILGHVYFSTNQLNPGNVPVEPPPGAIPLPGDVPVTPATPTIPQSQDVPVQPATPTIP